VGVGLKMDDILQKTGNAGVAGLWMTSGREKATFASSRNI
jgi:hypothetical protein